MTTLILHIDDGRDVTETFEISPELFAAVQEPEARMAFDYVQNASPLLKYFAAAVNERMENHDDT